MLLNKFEKHKTLRGDSRSVVGGRRGCPPPVTLAKVHNLTDRKITFICAGNAAKINYYIKTYINIHLRQKKRLKSHV